MTEVMQDTIKKPENINVVSAPVREDDGEITGVVFVTYRTEMYQNLLQTDIFDGQGMSMVIERSGDIVLSAFSGYKISSSSNIFLEEPYINVEKNRRFYALNSAIKSLQTGVATVELEGKLFYLHYRPLDFKLGDETAILLTYIPASIIDERVGPILLYTDGLLVIIIALFVLCATWYVVTYERQRKELMYLAYHDEVTGGGNSAYFEEKIRWRKGECGYLITLDVLHFKVINRVCGLEKGNMVIRRIWEILEQNLQSEELACHDDADYYLLFLKDSKREELLERLNTISQQVEALSKQLQVPKLKLSYGIVHTTNEQDVKLEIGKANECKQISKESDQSYTFYEDVDFDKILFEKELEEHFEIAIQNKEFEVWYQPKYKVDGVHLAGAEALVRWRKPDGTLIPPFQFIPLFERNGKISVLDEYVFECVCAQQKQWLESGQELIPISVNVSRASLYYSGVVKRYKELVLGYGLDPKFVPLEITESAILDDERVRDLIGRFHEEGFQLLMDDFGNGYSSLAALNILPFDVVKIDKSLVDYIGDEKGELLLSSVITLIRQIGMKITAEGVECKEQVAFLEKLQCDDIQGYYFSRPLPLQEFISLFSSSSSS